MEYDFRKIEKEWQENWKKNGVYKVSNDSPKPKYYVLDMFPYPSGAGLHVGHPLGYIASDIYSRYKRLKGFNVLHPMGFDSFGLPAEQYALETGQHPAETTKKNIATFKDQLDKIGFCYDWEREVQTSDPNYYRWTQWIFLQLFNCYYDKAANKAKPIAELVKIFETGGATGNGQQATENFTAGEWKAFSNERKEEILMNCRLAFSKYGEVNWCEALGTVLANDEVVNGVSERGGYPVEKKKMRQWYLRITDYADRLLEGLETVEFSESMKEMQRNWIGKSQGAEIVFDLKTTDDGQQTTEKLTVYTTRPDTIFGVDFMVVAPELDLVQQIKTPEQTAAVDEYIAYVKSRSDVDRMAEKKITGCFTGAYAINPFDGKQIPIWISEYVLAGYGTGAIMAVPCGDDRDFKFAQHFNIPITNIIGSYFNGEEANATKEAILENSGFLNGVKMADATEIVLKKLEEKGIGKRKVNYRMRDAGFSRQRYWGEPFPIIWSDGIALPLDAKELPLELPHVDKYGPGKNGEGPLSNLVDWVNVRRSTPPGVFDKRETSTMPGYAGSSWYFLRYMDPHNATTFCDRKASDYWNQVDLYIGGTEHAVGHLLYSRMWTKVLFDLGLIGFDEPFRKLLNQGMIQGVSALLRLIPNVSFGSENIDAMENSVSIKGIQSIFIDKDFNLELPVETFEMHIPISCIDVIDGKFYLTQEGLEKLKFEFPRFSNPEFITERHYQFLTGGEKISDADKAQFKSDKILLTSLVEKMSKSKLNVVNPNELCEKYGADTFRMYEMFLGPVEASKPWDTKGIEGVHRFLRKLWRLFNDDIKGKVWVDEKATDAELKILHRTIKKIEEDTEKFSFNTAVSAFMICVNDLFDAKCYKKEVLEKILILLVPYAPHIAEELWHQLGNAGTILDATYPTFNPALLVESNKEYPISINGKVRTNLSLALDLDQQQVEEIILQNETVQKWLEGKPPKKVIYVKNKMINVVV